MLNQISHNKLIIEELMSISPFKNVPLPKIIEAGEADFFFEDSTDKRLVRLVLPLVTSLTLLQVTKYSRIHPLMFPVRFLKYH